MSQYPAVLQLSGLNGSNGFRIDGVAAGDQLPNVRHSIDTAGDLNGDGYADIIIGAAQADPHGDASGAAYVVFGGPTAPGSTFQLSSLNGSNGFKISGESADYFAGASVAAAGDVNGDHIPDIVLAGEESGQFGSSGVAYVIFGTTSGYPANIDLSTINGVNGFKVLGAADSLASAGDFNHDGVGDLIFGNDQPNTATGEAFVLYGHTGAATATVDLTNLGAGAGFSMTGASQWSFTGHSVAAAGDVNGDGFGDVIVGALGDTDYRGAAYVVFGNAAGVPANLNLSTLDGHNGFKLSGVASSDWTGESVASAGDINGDGYADLIIGAPNVYTAVQDSGAAYVVFGKASGYSANLDLATLNGINGFRIDGTSSFSQTGISVASAGDVNGDGYSDLIVGAGALGASPNTSPGFSYVVFGGPGGFPAHLDLSTLDGTNGYRIDGVATADNSGQAVASAGDMNGDGLADLIVSAPGADPNGEQSGSTYVLYGQLPTTAVNLVGTAASQNLVGGNLNDILSGLGGNDHLYGHGGDDVLDGGPGDDIIDGGPGANTASYADATAGVIVSLTLQGSAQNTGGAGTDTLINIQNLIGSPYSDTIAGDGGANVIDGGPGDDSLDGGLGIDTLSYASATSGVTVSLSVFGAQTTGGGGTDSISHFENLTGSTFDDTLTGDDGANVIVGGGGNDTLNGLGGNDTLFGGSLMFGGDGNDTVTAAPTSDGPVFLSGGKGSDVLNGNGNPNAVAFYYTSAGGVTVDLSKQGVPQITGEGLDTLNGIHAVVGSTHNDTLIGGAADELFAGGPGADSIDGGGGFNLIDFSYDTVGGVTLNLSITGPQATGSWGTDTVTNIQAIGGSDFADTLTGDSHDNLLLGKDGDDILKGGDGNDTISGAIGNDTIDGGAGNDALDGGAGTDTASYADAASYVAVNLLQQGSVQDTVGAGLDTLTDVENLTGSAFNDFLYGDTNANVLEGGAGDDWLNGRGGSDTASYASATAGVTINLGISASPQNTGGAGTDTLLSIENLIGSTFNDTLSAGTFAASLQGGAGNDTLVDGAGGDTLDGGAGVDTASYASSASGVTVNLGVAGIQHTGGAGNDTLTSIEILIGSNFADTLTAASTGSSIQGGGGGDTLLGNAGNDKLDGGAGADTASYATATAGVTVSLAVPTAQNTVGAGIDTLTSIESVVGSAFKDTLTAADSGSALHGGGGNDTLVSGAGNDVLDGGAGAVDVASYANATVGVTVSLANASAQNTIGAGTDTLTGIESLTGSAFKDDLTAASTGSSLFGGASADVLHGGIGNDVLNGGGAADILTGGGGQDSLTGGAGADHFVYLSLTDSTNAAPDTITDFFTSDVDRIDLSGIDANAALAGDQAFHLGGGGGHAGDIVATYDAGNGRTVLQLYVDNDASVDATIWVTGNHSSFTAADFIL